MIIRELITLLGFNVDSSGTDKYNNLMKNVVKVTAAATAIVSGAGAAFLKMAGDMEQNEIAFTTMLGSAEEAGKLIEEIKDFATTTPFELTGLVDSSKQLLAFGIESDKIIDTMTVLGNISAGVGRDKLPTLVRAFGKISTKGRATMEELNMFLEAGVPILDSLAEGYGVTTDTLFAMISTGQVGFADVEAALNRLGTGSGQFGGLMEEQSKSFLGILSNIQDFLTNLATDIGKELLPVAKELSTQFLAFVEANKEVIKQNIVKFFTGFGKLLSDIWKFAQGVIDALGGFKGIIGIVKTLAKSLKIILPILIGIAAYQKTVAIITGLTKAWTIAQGILNGVMSLNPIGLIISAVVGAVALIVANWETLAPFFKWLWDGLVNIFTTAWNGITSFFTGLWEGIKSIASSAWEWIKDIFEKLGNFLGDVAKFLGLDKLGEEFKKMFEFFSGVGDKIKEVFQGIADFIKPILDPIFAAINAVKEFLGIGDTTNKVTTDQNLETGRTIAGSQAGRLGGSIASGAASAARSRRGATNINVQSSVSVQVPNGTPTEQADFVETKVRDVVREEFQKVQTGINNNSPAFNF